MEQSTFRREPPWSGAGFEVSANTAAQALKDADLDWDAVKAPALFQDPATPLPTVITEKYFMIRSDTGDVLSDKTVSERYEPIQNRNAFQLFDSLAGSGDIEYEHIGSMGGGRRMWMTARVGEELLVNGEDPVNLYLLLMNSFDASSAMKVAITPVRAWCQNTLNIALAQAKSRWTVHHTTKAEQRLSDAQAALGLTAKYATEFEKKSTELARASMSDAEFDRFINRFTKDLDKGERFINEVKERTAEIFHESENLENVRGTKWAALNAVGEYFDWDRPRNEHSRAVSAWTYNQRYRNSALRLLR